MPKLSLLESSLQQGLYQKNTELNAANFILSLTRKLYQISLHSLDVERLAEKISGLLQSELRLEMAGIFEFNRSEDLLSALAISKSEHLLSVLRRLGLLLREIKITECSKRAILKEIFDGNALVTTKLSDIWGGLVEQKDLEQLSVEAGFKTLFIYPLLTEECIIGVVMFAYSITVDQIGTHEKESFQSLVDIIAVSLGKAYADRDLKAINQNLTKVNQDIAAANLKLKTLDETKNNILSFASHFLQTPMTDIIAASEMMLGGSSDEMTSKNKALAAKIFESAKHLSLTTRLWSKVLDFEEGKVKYQMSEFDLEELIQQLQSEWTNVAVERYLDLSFETDGHAPYSIIGDRIWIKDVIVNLIDNAFKMTSSGFIKMKLERFAIETIRFSITDSGVGMSEETLSSLFEKFDKGKEAWARDVQGTGLGLYICKMIIEGNGGKIAANSQGSNRGSTFYVDFHHL